MQQSFDYVLNVKFDIVHEPEENLRDIVAEVHRYLDAFGRNKLFLLVGKAHFQKCCRSWAKISSSLEKFLIDPKCNYSFLMTEIEHELNKFPQQSFYAKKLKELKQLIVQGPQFHCVCNQSST